jgi:uncharacterized protein
MKFKDKYGKTALIAGASEGLGAAFAEALASQGMDIVLVARRAGLLETKADEIRKNFSVQVKNIVCDLGKPDALEVVRGQLKEIEIDVLVYNAAQPFIGHFEKLDAKGHEAIAIVNMVSPLSFVHYFGSKMVGRKRGAIILMSSLAGRQGSGYISTYAATKAFNLVLAEGLWYEWRSKNVDVLACSAGVTVTPNFIDSKPGKLGLFEPQAQLPEDVVKECFKNLGRKPSFISGRGNRIAHFFMNNILSRKLAVTIMGDATKKIYGIEG